MVQPTSFQVMLTLPTLVSHSCRLLLTVIHLLLAYLMSTLFIPLATLRTTFHLRRQKMDTLGQSSPVVQCSSAVLVVPISCLLNSLRSRPMTNGSRSSALPLIWPARPVCFPHTGLVHFAQQRKRPAGTSPRSAKKSWVTLR